MGWGGVCWVCFPESQHGFSPEEGRPKEEPHPGLLHGITHFGSLRGAGEAMKKSTKTKKPDNDLQVGDAGFKAADAPVLLRHCLMSIQNHPLPCNCVTEGAQ